MGFLDYLMIFAHVGVVITFVILVITYRQVYLALRRRQTELRALQGPQAEENEVQKCKI